jgi:aminoglycoside phosphotransferase (APT) family kinase protein
MQRNGSETNGDLTCLIAETLRRNVDPSATPVWVTSEPIEAGMSGTDVLRHHVAFDTDREYGQAVSLVSKRATLVERRVLALLQDQLRASVPFNYSPNLVDDVLDFTCMEDLGSEHRPTSLDPVPAHLIAAEARALAAIHHANLGHADELSWLPRVDRLYVQDQLTRFWTPAWRRAIKIEAFRQEFGDWVAIVEAATAGVTDELEEVTAHRENMTLIHGDINPSNVLIIDGKPRFIDWQAACLGPFYLDLPHHLFTLEMAEEYRRDREKLGGAINPDDFAAGYRAASHYIGLRYIWWTLELWHEDPTQSRWVRYYLELIGR